MTRRQWMVVISLAGLFLAVYLTLYHYGTIGVLACNVGSCEKVQASRWSMFLGLPVAAWGIGFYLVMLILSILGMRAELENLQMLASAMLVLAMGGLLFTGWLNFLEAFVIHAWCEWCLGSAAMVLLLFGLCFVEWRAVRDDGRN
jgi:uncharacterized membrane protein